MKIYVAGRIIATRNVKSVQQALREDGHEITWDWTQVVEGVQSGAIPPDIAYGEEFKRDCARNDIKGVKDADLIVAVAGPEWLGTAVEIGLSLAWRKQLLFYGTPHRDSVFWHLPDITMLPLDIEVLKARVRVIAEAQDVVREAIASQDRRRGQ